jgi:hypothetical protein
VAKPRLHLQALSGRAARAYRADCFDPAPSDPNRDAILEGLSPAFVLLGFDLQADDIEVEGFVFEEHFNAAVFTRETASGHFVHDNLFQDYFASGMNFNNGGAKRAVVRKNCFRITSDRGAGNAMRADQGLRNALIDRNRFFQSGQSGMALAPLEDIEDLTISHNLGVRELTLLFIARSVGTRVIGNDALDSDPGPFLAGVFWFGEHNRDTLIARNRVRRGPTGFRFDHSLGVRPNVNLRVLHNHIAEMSGSGMLAPTEEDPPDPGLVDSLFFANSSVSNAQDGIRFEAGGATGNLVIRNHLRRNGEHDCHDDTVGAGTAGTANTWRDNDALTENRPGLCPPRDDRGAG